MDVDARVSGVPELKELLSALPGKLRKQALRNALAAGARLVRDEAKANAVKKMAEEAMANRETDIDFAVAQTELAIALAQLAAIHKLR